MSYYMAAFVNQRQKPLCVHCDFIKDYVWLLFINIKIYTWKPIKSDIE